MGAPLPCLGYPSKTHAIVALRAQGLTTKAIAERVGVTAKRVKDFERERGNHTAGRTSSPAGRKSNVETGSLAGQFPLSTLELIRRHAARRDMSADRLIREIVERVVEDDIVDAVLDDREGCS